MARKTLTDLEILYRNLGLFISIERMPHGVTVYGRTEASVFTVATSLAGYYKDAFPEASAGQVVCNQGEPQDSIAKFFAAVRLPAGVFGG